MRGRQSDWATSEEEVEDDPTILTPKDINITDSDDDDDTTVIYDPRDYDEEDEERKETERSERTVAEDDKG